MVALQHFVLATAGHVDHGKSALVKALTGTDPDRLPEEKARGITIDLGFAHLDLPPYRLGIVDVPGHEDFVKNMVAGVGSIDLAMFVVAADDGWMPQSEEHLQILNYLGVSRAVVALTKVDLVEPQEARVADEIRAKLGGTPFADAPIVATSVVSGRGLEELKTALRGVLAKTPAPRDIGKPRLPVDRVFSLRGIGTVVTGTLSGGELRRGQAVVIQPSGLQARVRSLQSYNRDVEASVPGMRTAAHLSDVAVEQIHRGEVVTLAEFGGGCRTFDAMLEMSPRAARSIRSATRVRLHLGSGNTGARALLLDAGQLAPGQRALARLRCEAPLFAFVGDRFIVRDWAEQATLCGGVVLDVDGADWRLDSAVQRQFLRMRAERPDDAGTYLLSEVRRRRALRRSALPVRSRFSGDDLARSLSVFSAQGQLVVTGDWIVAADWWQQWVRRAGDAIAAAHREHPERVGLDLNELRQGLVNDLPSAALFDAIVAALKAAGFAQVGGVMRCAAHRPELPPRLQAAGVRLRTLLNAKPLDPPARKELAGDIVSQQALRFLLDSGEAVELSAELVMLTEHFWRAAEIVKATLRQRGSATASELRQALNTTRRVVIPLLEKLDRDGVTVRQGASRRLRSGGPSVGREG
jgi:selenocysteine-specific elongation factor